MSSGGGGPPAFTPESDSEDELPPGWEERATVEGQVFYANHLSKSTQWTHPRTGKSKKVPVSLPFGWERQVQPDGKVVYLDHQNKRTTFTDPRLAFSVESGGSGTSGDFRQRFDASSSALQILHGTDLSAKTVIVTGANSGIGLETARSLAFHGCSVIFACRSIAKAEAAIAVIHRERPRARCRPMQVDLTSLRSVSAFASAFLADFEALDVLVLNAAVFGIDFRLTPEDRCEEMFQVNYLSQVYLAHLLKDRLSRSLKPKIVVVSSESHRFSSLTRDTISGRILSPSYECKNDVDDDSVGGFVSTLAYNDSKLLGLMFALEASERWHRSGIRCVAVHPGNMVSSNLGRQWWVYRLLFALVRPFSKSLQQAASCSVFAAFSSEMDDARGIYVNNCCPCEPSPLARDPEARKRCWEATQRLLCQKLEGVGEETFVEL